MVETRSLGPLNCHLVDRLPAGKRPDLGVVLAHGYGAPGDDLVPIADEVFRRAPDLNQSVRFVFPEAPLQLPLPLYEARAWYPLDVDRIQRMVRGGKSKTITAETPEGLAAARRKLRGVVEALQRETGLARNRVVVGGFSQGAVTAIDVVLRLDKAPAALFVLSGSLQCAPDWRERAPKRKGLHVVQSHGRQDQVLPYSVAEQLRDLLKKGGLDVEFIPFDGGHTVPGAVVSRLAALLGELRKN